MKNVLAYYYNINPLNIYQNGKVYRFEYQNNNYYFIDITDNKKNINDVYNISIELKKNGIYCHEIVLNSDNSVITYLNNKIFILLKVSINTEKKISLYDIIYYTYITTGRVKGKNNWYNLWINKIDYLEYKINENKIKYPLLWESCDFFFGIVETGISMLYDFNFDINYSICHSRIGSHDTIFELYNPLNFILDCNMRDIAEYFKDVFLYHDPYNEIVEYISKYKIDNDNLKMFFIRMFFPSFYIDKFEEIIDGLIDEESIIPIVNKAHDYEILLSKLYNYIGNIILLPNIEWLKKM